MLRAFFPRIALLCKYVAEGMKKHEARAFFNKLVDRSIVSMWENGASRKKQKWVSLDRDPLIGASQAAAISPRDPPPTTSLTDRYAEKKSEGKRGGGELS